MSANVKKTNRQKIVFRVFVTIVAIFLVWLLTIFCWAFFEGQFLSYVDDLRGWQNDFSEISGEPRLISRESYFKKREEMTNEVSTDIYPYTLVNEELYFYYFSETVKPNRFYVDRCEIYISCKWDSESFSLEKERLATIKGANGKNPLLSQDLFPFPAYVFIYRNGHFKYALIDDNELTITYICLLEIGSIENVVFEQSLAPQKRIQDSDLSKKGEHSVFFGKYYY